MQVRRRFVFWRGSCRWSIIVGVSYHWHTTWLLEAVQPMLGCIFERKDITSHVSYLCWEL